MNEIVPKWEKHAYAYEAYSFKNENIPLDKQFMNEELYVLVHVEIQKKCTTQNQAKYIMHFINWQ